jgi:hypothetical protein
MSSKRSSLQSCDRVLKAAHERGWSLLSIEYFESGKVKRINVGAGEGARNAAGEVNPWDQLLNDTDQKRPS